MSTWPGPTRRSGSTIWGGWAAAAAELSGDLWRISQDGLSVTGAAAAVPMPLAHTVELNAGTVDTDDRPAPARQLDLGALGTGSRAGQPAEPAVV